MTVLLIVVLAVLAVIPTVVAHDLLSDVPRVARWLANNGVVYYIDDVGNGVAVDYPKNFKFLGESEHTFTRIDPTQIIGAEDPKGNWTPNPNYVPRNNG